MPVKIARLTPVAIALLGLLAPQAAAAQSGTAPPEAAEALP